MISRVVLAGLCAFVTLGGHDIITTKLTYTRDISRIFARRCVSCHSASTSIPLTSYEQVRPWAVSIKEQVLSRQMPPWGAVKGFGDLFPDNSLTQEEIFIIAAWVVGGSPNGDAALLPKSAPDIPAPPLTVIKDALDVTGSVTIHSPLLVAGIRPMGTKTIESTRITAHFPDGHREPLLWLYQYNPVAGTTFRFRSSIVLPAGTIVEAGAPVEFALVTPAVH